MWYGIFIFAAALVFIIFCARLSTKTLIVKRKPNINMRGYELFYSDQKTSRKEENVIYSKLLVSEKYNIKGKPDYIFRNKSGLKMIPVELKSGSIGNGNSPREGDLMQLVTYFLIIEDVYQIIPHEGRLVYKDCMFIVPNTKALRKRLKNILKDMQDMLKTGEQEAFPSFAKCKSCICRGTVCEYCEY